MTKLLIQSKTRSKLDRGQIFFAAFHQEFNSNMNIIVMHILFI